MKALADDVLFIQAVAKLVKYDGTLGGADGVKEAGGNGQEDEEGYDAKDDEWNESAIIHKMFMGFLKDGLPGVGGVSP